MNSLPMIITRGTFATSSESSASVAGDPLKSPTSLSPSPITPTSPAEHPSVSSTPFSVAIIGGGIGGLTAALFLEQLCNTPAHPEIEVSIYEQANEYKEIGSGIGLGPNAAKLLARLQSEIDGTPILDAINAISGSRNGVWFGFRRFDTGEEIVTVPSNEPEDARIRLVAVSRAELHRILLKHVQKKHETIGGRLFTGKKLVSISEDDDDPETTSGFSSAVNDDGKKLKPVKITFQDGTAAVADLVIAADGIRSAVRRQFIADEPIYGNKILYRGLVPMSLLPNPWPMSSHVAMWNAIRAHFIMYPISANKTVNIIACKDKPLSELDSDLAHESWVTPCDRSELEQDFVDFKDPLVEEIIQLMPQQVSKWRINDRRPIDKWVFMNGRVVLLGDAAHPMLPHQSAGAGQAVEDAYILAKALSRFLLLGNEKWIVEKEFPPSRGVAPINRSSPPHDIRLDPSIENNGHGSDSLFKSEKTRMKDLSVEGKNTYGSREEDYEKKTVARLSWEPYILEKWMTLYQKVRIPRAARAQVSSRKAGEVFEMMGSEMEGKSYEERLAILREQAKENMKWIWTEDIDAAWEKGLAEMD